MAFWEWLLNTLRSNEHESSSPVFRTYTAGGWSVENGGVKRHEKNGRRILVVDDDRHICDLLQLILSFHGFEVEGAGSAAEAQALLERLHFDAATIDLYLPDARGEELAVKVRAAYPNIGVAVLSGDDPEATLPDGVAYLRKPTEIADLITAIKRISGVEE